MRSGDARSMAMGGRRGHPFPGFAGTLRLLAAILAPAAAGAAAGAGGPKPILEYRFEGDLADSAGSRPAGTAHGAVRFLDGRRGKCASFDGRSWIDTGVAGKDVGAEFTVECWVNPAGGQVDHADIFGNHVPEALGFVLQQDGASANRFYAACGAGAGRWVMTPAVPLAAGRWQHVALVKARDELRLHVNGVPVASFGDGAPAPPSPMAVAVGLGYGGSPDRCFRGLIDDFRIWDGALASFEHAGIDPAFVRETLAERLDPEPRPAAGEPVGSWDIATADTRATLAVTAAGELSVHALADAAGSGWIARPVAFPLWPAVDVAGERKEVRWRFAGAKADGSDGQKVTLRFAAEDPALEATSEWDARPGPGPVHHRLRIRNASARAVTIGEQATFDLDLAGATELWFFHGDGGTPDAVGVYRRPLDRPGRRWSADTAPTGQFIPYCILDEGGRRGVYLGLEWSFCRIEAVTLAGGPSAGVRVRAGNRADLRVELAPGEEIEARPGFIGAYRGDVDDAGNGLRRWLFRYRVPEALRRDPGYPKVQWNAFGATGKAPGSWDPVEAKYYPLVDDIAPLGFEEVMIDVGWWQGDEPDPDAADWPSGMARAAGHAHAKGLRFGLYWTDPLDMASPEARRKRGDRIRRLFREHRADMWRSDSTRGEVIGASHAATRGFYELVDELAKEIPGFQWENCSGGGRIKDYGAMARAAKIFNSDTYSALHVRQAFFDSSHAFCPMQIEGHLGSTDGRFRPRGVAGMRYAFRSASLGAPEWFLDAPNGGNGTSPWTAEEKEAVRACVATYKERIRPLVRGADLYHVLPRPDGRGWDGIEYWDPAAGKGVVCIFKPGREPAAQAIRLRGLEAGTKYRLTFQDGSAPPAVRSGAELMGPGLPVSLPGEEVSELVFMEAAR